MKAKQGFTLIELILYVALVTTIMAAMIPFARNIIGAGVKSATQQEISSNARYVSERIKYEIRRSNGVTIASGSNLSLTNLPPDTTTVFDLSSGKVRISKNGGSFINLNSDDTAVTILTFTNYSSGSLTKHVQFVFTLQSNFDQTRSEYRGTIIVEGSAEVRSN